MTPFGICGSSHWTTTLLELTGLARTFIGGLPGTAFGQKINWNWFCGIEVEEFHNYQLPSSTETQSFSLLCTRGGIDGCLLVALPAVLGQHPPGQYPPDNIPPGQYPPGQYPPSTVPPTLTLTLTLNPNLNPNPNPNLTLILTLILTLTLTGGTVEGGYCPGGYCPGGILSGGILSGGILSGGVLSGVILSGGILSGGILSWYRFLHWSCRQGTLTFL